MPAVPDEEYEYNGLNWRTLRQIRKEYTSPMEFTGQQSRRFYYTPSWQLIEERLDDADAAGDDRYAQQFWGIRYIDDAIHRRVATKASYDADSGFTDDESFFYLNDVQFSTIAMLGFPDTPGDHPELIERVRYDSYGTARHIDPYDINGNGTNFDADDKSRASAATPSFPVTETPITDASYDVDVDIDFNGAVGIVEGAVAQTGTQAAGLPAGQISDPDGIDNPIGYDGYVFNDSVELYTARHRHYDTRQGRWLERDPFEYIDGSNLYQYVTANPLTQSDPYGQQPSNPGVGINPGKIESDLRKWQQRCHDNSCVRQQIRGFDSDRSKTFFTNLCKGHGYSYPSGCVRVSNDCLYWELDRIKRQYPASYQSVIDCAVSARIAASKSYPRPEDKAARNQMQHCYYSSCLHKLPSLGATGAGDILRAHECCHIHIGDNDLGDLTADLNANSMGSSCARGGRDSLGCCQRKVRAKYGK